MWDSAIRWQYCGPLAAWTAATEPPWKGSRRVRNTASGWQSWMDQNVPRIFNASLRPVLLQESSISASVPVAIVPPT